MKKITTLLDKDYFKTCSQPHITIGLNADVDDGVTVRFGIVDYKNTDEYYVWYIEVYSEIDNDENDLLKRFECGSIDEFNNGMKEQLEKWYIENDKKFYRP